IVKVGDHAFANCTALESVTISDNIMKVGEYAFFGCDNLTIFCKEESQPDGWAKEWNNSKRPVVWDCAQSGKTEDGIKWGLNNDGQMIVAGYSGISSVLEIPSTIEGYAVDGICEGAFRENQTIKTVRIASGIKSIGDSVFEQCRSMMSVTIPLSVKSVGEHLFLSCNANLTIYCEYATALRAWWSVLSWNDYKVVWGYNNVTSDANFDYVVRDGKAYLTKYKGEETSVIIPQTIGGVEVVSIGEVFYNNETLTDVTIAGVVRLDKYAFMGCSALRSVTFADDRLTSIGDYAFDYCKNLTDIIIPASVTEIGQYAFFDCISLQEVAFANTDGWYVTGYKDDTDGVDMDVTDVSRNATRLSSDYYYRFYWKRNILIG
ncbi:MAG: leucine-rich repeat domain-containing protein, partial [Clostridia bacterium]|nr:leucine-rich repeat domain-containing protein [Clostridia bacterium]